MLQISRFLVILLAFLSTVPLGAANPDRDFSGKWVLDLDSSNLRALSVQPDELLTVVETDTGIQCTATNRNGDRAMWSYALDGSENRYRVRGEGMNSIVKWEGSALLVNTLVSGPGSYTVMDRWKLSPDRSVLTIARQIERGGAESEGTLVYRREGYERTEARSARVEHPVGGPTPTAEVPVLSKRPALPAATDITVPEGTRIPLVMLNSVDTKHSHEGDRIYLQTSFPVSLGGRIVIPRGSAVTGVVTQTKAPGRTTNKGELFIRFETLTLPNGVSRDFHARVSAADGTGEVDRKEGKITGESGKGDARKIGEGVGIGGTGGVLLGGAAGHPIGGAGIGAATGLAAVLLSRNKGVVLPKGTSVEMILDRDLHYTAEELRPQY